MESQELLLRAYEVRRSRRGLLARGAAVWRGVMAWDRLAALVGDKLTVVVLRVPLLLLLPSALLLSHSTILLLLLLLLPSALLLLPSAILPLGILLLTAWHSAPSVAELILGRRLLLELG